MTHPIRYAILLDAIDQPGLWHLPNASYFIHADGSREEEHPAHTVEELRPHLADLLREGHVEIFPFREPKSPALSLDDALAVVADDSNWKAETAATWYGVITTDSGNREFRVEREAYHRAR